MFMNLLCEWCLLYSSFCLWYEQCPNDWFGVSKWAFKQWLIEIYLSMNGICKVLAVRYIYKLMIDWDYYCYLIIHVIAKLVIWFLNKNLKSLKITGDTRDLRIQHLLSDSLQYQESILNRHGLWFEND